jgi:acetyltransferase-like isoleucine patch superfamily enzyme
VGRDVYIGKGCTIEVDGSIGDSGLIANRLGIVGRRDHAMRQVGAPIRRADWVGDHPHRLSRPVHIGDDVWIGYGAVVLSGLSIGRGAVVAAGAVVTSDVDPYVVVAGNPAIPVGRRFEGDAITAHELLLGSAAGARHRKEAAACGP